MPKLRQPFYSMHHKCVSERMNNCPCETAIEACVFSFGTVATRDLELGARLDHSGFAFIREEIDLVPGGHRRRGIRAAHRTWYTILPLSPSKQSKMPPSLIV